MSEPRTVVLDDGFEYEVVEDEERSGRRPLVILLILLLLLLAGLVYLAVSVSRMAGRPDSGGTGDGLRWIRSIYGYGPAPAEQLKRPTDTAITADGSIWVTDGQNSRLLRFGPDGGFRSAIEFKRGLGRNQLGALEAVAVDPDGVLYITDGLRGMVIKVEPSGRIVKEWPIPFPGDISVNEQRVVVTGPNGVAIFDRDGTQLALLGTKRGSDEELFDIPRGVVVAADGTMYVSDTQNKRVKAYDPTGKLLWTSNAAHKDVLDPQTGEIARTVPESSETSGLAHAFQLPVGLTLDGNGRLVVLDPFEFGLWVLDPKKKGEFVAHYGEFGQQDGTFTYPTRLDYDPARDWFAVADTTNDRVQIVEIPGSGGTAGSKLRRLLDIPWWLCCIPLIALLVAAVLLMAARHRSRALADGDTEPGEGGGELGPPDGRAPGAPEDAETLE